MAWTYNSIRIIVQEKGSTMKQNIARLQPIEGPTIKQTFGYESPVHKLQCTVVGDTDLANLKASARTGVAYELNGWGTDYGDFELASVSEQRVNCISQTLRTDLACDSPVYLVELELYE